MGAGGWLSMRSEQVGEDAGHPGRTVWCQRLGDAGTRSNGSCGLCELVKSEALSAVKFFTSCTC